VPDFLRALRSRNYRLYFIGQLVSLAGTWMQQVAMIWLAYRLSDSALVLGVIGFASQIPILLFASLSGVWVDRFDRRRILLATQSLAMFQALLLSLQDHQLKHKHPSGLIRNFPPLQTMESLLFGFLWAGWVVLSLSLLSGWLFFEDLFAQHLVHKTVLSCIAWVVFAVLLWGRHQLGWRGHKAIRWTLAGFCLLMLAYFGSKLVREFILHI